MKVTVIRGLSNAWFLWLLFLTVLSLVLPFGFTVAVSGPLEDWTFWPSGEWSGIDIFLFILLLVTIAVPFLSFILFVILYAVFCYIKRAVISTTEVCIKTPFKKDVSFAKSGITFFGMVHMISFGFRGLGLYICNAPKEQILAYLEEHMDACKQAFPLISVEEYCKKEETRWKIALKFYVRQRQPGVYFLAHGNKKRAQMMEKAFGKPATNLDMLKSDKAGGFPDRVWI